MKHAKSQTLMFQLVLFFSGILVAVFLLIAYSWDNARWETRTNEAINALTTPYTQLYTELDAVNKSFSYVGRRGWMPNNLSEDVSDIESASASLMAVLNADGFHRASVDLNNTIGEYLSIYQSIIASYDAKDYATAIQGVSELGQVEQWVRDYLKDCNSAVTQRRDALLAESDARRDRYYRGTLALGIAIFIACAATLLMTARRLVAPIQALCQNVKAFRLTDSLEALKQKGVPCKPRSLVEIRTLATAIYSMQNTVLDQYTLEKNNELLRARLSEEALRTATIERRLRETELRALQAQINPHFLFNTLNMIAQTSYIEGAEHTTELLETFSDYFRYNVENFEHSVTLAEELANVRGYVALQRERFGERIAYVIEADDAVMGIRVPCLIVQPLVENALSHGLRMKTEGGEVRVAIRAAGEDGFEIAVSDNGCGMTADALERLLRRATQPEEDDESGHRSIGISNVVRRLKIAFGENVALRAESAPDEGMRIAIRVERGKAA